MSGGGGGEGGGHPHPPLPPPLHWLASRERAQEGQRGWRVTPREALRVSSAHCSIRSAGAPAKPPHPQAPQEKLTWTWGSSVGGVPPSSQTVLPAGHRY